MTQRSTLKVKVIGQRSRSPGQKMLFEAHLTGFIQIMYEVKEPNFVQACLKERVPGNIKNRVEKLGYGFRASRISLLTKAGGLTSTSSCIFILGTNHLMKKELMAIKVQPWVVTHI